MRSLLLLALALAACASDDYTQLYATDDKAPSFDKDDIEHLDHLGATVVDDGSNFGVYSEHADRIDLLLFDDPEAVEPTRQFEMVRFGDVWNLYVEGVGVGQHYGFIAWGPNWPVASGWHQGDIDGFLYDVDPDGNRYNPNKLLVDPYARAIHRDHDWSKGSTASGPRRTESTWAAASKAVIVESKYEWSDGEAAWREARAAQPAWNDMIIYEVHPKGFTASSASAVEHPGTYRGLGEKAEYFSDLGITAVELMPVHEKPLDGGYWGYQTLGFFSPELQYAADPRPGYVIDEFKWMVDQLHQQGVEVILDVVYNHTGEGGLWREKIAETDNWLDPTIDLVNFDPKEVAGLYSFRGLDNQAYYALDLDHQTYWNNTGVGNQTRTNHTPLRRLIIDSLRYWAEEMHVDGFRFDLAPILGAADEDYNSWGDPADTVVGDIIDDPVLRQHNIRVIAEPWAAGGCHQAAEGGGCVAFDKGSFFLGDFPASAEGGEVGWYEWNGNFRDVWRGFVNYDDRGLNVAEGSVDVGGALYGSQSIFSGSSRKPYHSVNFVTVHDGFTMYDIFSYDQKQNDCGPLNPVCCGAERLGPFCDRDSGESNNRSRDWGMDQEPLKRQLMRNLFVATLLSRGTPMILGGDEWIRTQLGNNNAYSNGADNPFNWFDWGSWQANDERHRMHDFVRKLTAFRKANLAALAPLEYEGGDQPSWKSPQNTDMTDWSGKALMVHYWSATPELLILINMYSGPVDFTLPSGRSWLRRIDTQAWYDEETFIAEQDARTSYNVTPEDAAPIPGSTYGVVGRSIVVLEAAPE